MLVAMLAEKGLADAAVEPSKSADRYAECSVLLQRQEGQLWRLVLLMGKVSMVALEVCKFFMEISILL